VERHLQDALASHPSRARIALLAESLGPVGMLDLVAHRLRGERLRRRALVLPELSGTPRSRRAMRISEAEKLNFLGIGVRARRAAGRQHGDGGPCDLELVRRGAGI